MIGLHVARILKAEYNYVPKQLVFAGCRPLHVRTFFGRPLAWPGHGRSSRVITHLSVRILFFRQMCVCEQRWGWPMNYYREDDDEMVDEMVKCGGEC
jgi:hypothetical protein